MCNASKNGIFYCLLLICAALALTACGSSSSTAVPTTVPNSATIFYAHNLVFKNSTTLSTGYNGFGQLGTGDLGSRTVPGLLSQYYPFTGFAVGGNHSVAFTNNSSAVYSWGYNGYGQLGNASTTYSSVPVRSGTLTGVTAVAAGAYHTLVMKNDNTVWAWGGNDTGQLGIGWSLTNPGYTPIPQKVVGSTGSSPFVNLSSIAANGKHSLARADGKVWAWGLNSSGQAGRDPAITGAIADPMIVTGIPAGVSAIAAGSGFSYAVSANGTLWAWGANDNGQLGNGTLVSSYTPVQVLTAPGTPLTGVVQAAGGIQHGLARLSNGEVWAWGYNFFGQLGIGPAKDSSFAVKVLLVDVNNVPLKARDIRAFGSSSMALTDGGVWYVWGDNAYGQLGIGLSGTQATIVSNPRMMSGF